MARYSDISIDFIRHPLTKDITKKTDSAAVKQAVKNLILMDLAGKPFHPEVTFGLKAFLFENFTPLTVAAFRRRIDEILYIYEPRINVLDLQLEEDLDANQLMMTLWFSVVNIPQPIDLTLYIERVR